MDSTELLQTLRQLETEMHREETRRDASRLTMLLHPDFEEFGRSGVRYSRADVLVEFASGKTPDPVVSKDFELAVLNDDTALLTYATAHVDSSGTLVRHTLRSSIWVLTADGWQMRFHQGTPVE